MAALVPNTTIFPNLDNPDFKAKLAHYITHTKGGYFLRKFDLKVQSCYISSVVYILICMFPELSPPEMTEKLKIVLKYRKFNLKILNNLVGGNTADVTSIPISKVQQLDDVFENGIVFLGLVTPPQEESAPFGTIFHYFLLRRDEEGAYSILSSYGSMFVAMRQYQTPLTDPEEMNKFIENLANPTKDDAAIKGIDSFMRKYFLNPMYKTIQRKEFGDMDDMGLQTLPASDLRWLKNEPGDIDTEIGVYQKGPTYVMLFPNMLDIFRAEIAALELKGAEKKLESLDIEYNDYLAIHRASEKASQDAMTNITATKAKIEAAGIEISKIEEEKIAATIEQLTPDKLAGVEGEARAEYVQSDLMKTPQKVVPSRDVLSPPSPFMRSRVKRSRKGTPEKPAGAEDEAEDAADAAKETADKAAEEEAAEKPSEHPLSPKEYQELNELGLVSPDEKPTGGKRTRKKNKKTKRRKSRMRK